MSLERLILFRHGKALERAASGRDFDRALAPPGREEAKAIAERLAAAGFVPGLALVSSARRTIETWEAAAPAFPGTRLEAVRALYDASASLMLDTAEAAGAASVLLIGHNPGIHALAFELAARGQAEPAQLQRLNDGFPPAAAAVFRFAPAGAVCEAVFYPGDLGP